MSLHPMPPMPIHVKDQRREYKRKEVAIRGLLNETRANLKFWRLLSPHCSECIVDRVIWELVDIV